MKKTLACAVVLLLATFCSCRKESSPIHPSLDSTMISKDININLTYQDNIDSLGKDQWELIVTEPAGKLLLDTVADANIAIMAKLHTDAYVVNLTYVTYSAFFNDYNVTTYRNVNPRSWTGLPNPGGFTLVASPNDLTSTIASVYYTHPPQINNFNGSDMNTLFVSDYTAFLGILNTTYQPNYPAYQPGGLLSTSYTSHPGNPVYTLFPQLGLYNFHTPPATGDDTVDLSHMDTAVRVNYSLPQGYSMIWAYLSGYVDTTDLTRSMTLFYNTYTASLPADLEYPTSGVQTYQTVLQANNNTTFAYLGYSTYGKTVPSSAQWITDDSYTLHSNTQDSFSVSFNGAKPSFYLMKWQWGNNYLTISSAPDGATFHPYTWLNHLGSKLLQGQSFSPLTPWFLSIMKATGLPANYNTLLNFYATPATVSAPVGSTFSQYDLTFY